MINLFYADDGQIDKIEFQFASFYQGQKDHASMHIIIFRKCIQNTVCLHFVTLSTPI